MFRRTHRRRIFDGALALLAATGLTTGARAVDPAPAEADRGIVAAVVIDGDVADEPIVLHRHGTALFIASADLHRLGVRTTVPDGAVALSSLPGFDASFDDATQTLTLHDRAANRPARLSAAGPAARQTPITPSGWGAIVTYDANVTHTSYGNAAAVLTDTSLFTPAGYGFATLLADAGGQGQPPHVDRLATGYTMTDPDRLRRATLGDFVPAATSWSRPVRMAGVQLSTDFSLRPDLVTFPLPDITGSAAVPSAVDLIVNGAHMAVGPVKAGQFAVTDVPAQAGLNTVAVAVRDALGRETVQNVSLYASRALLRPGLADYSLELGAVRVGYGGLRDHYGALAWSGSLRRGISDRLTVEAHGEGDFKTTALGTGVTVGLGLIGQIDASVAASGGHGPAAAQFAVGYERIGRRVRITARYGRTGAGYRDLAARYGTVNRADSLVLNIGFDLGRLGTAGGGIVSLGRGRLLAAPQPTGYLATAAYPTAPFTLRASTLVTGNWSARLGQRWSLIATGGADLRRRGAGYAAVSLLAILGRRTSVAATATARGDGSSAVTEVARSALLPGDWGYRANVARGGIDRLAGSVEYQGTAGHVEVAAERVAGADAVRMSARGGLVLAGGTVSAVDARSGSLALVDTGGVAGVTVYRDNRPVGVTDAHGKLIVANLNAFQTTKLSIDPLELADEVAIDASDIVIRPSERAGVAARFALHRMAGVVAHLIDGAGLPLPAGARAQGADAVDLPIGEDGALFIEHAQADMLFSVRLPNGQRCVAHIRAPHLAGPVTEVPHVRCVTTQMASLQLH